MGTYNSAVITNGGQSMIAQAVAGASLEFTTLKHQITHTPPERILQR